MQIEHAAEEVKRLRRCINDLVSVLALPAMWSSAEPSGIVHNLLDALIGMLHLDLVYVRLQDPVAEGAIEMFRVAQARRLVPFTQVTWEALKNGLGDDPRKWPSRIRNPIRDGEISITLLPLGLRDEIGLVVAGTERADFPSQTERLLLSVAANQAAIGLQEARILSEQKKIAHELERQVAERTARIAAANEDLREEISEREKTEVKLRRSEADLLEAQRLTQTCSWKHDIRSGRVSVSPEALRMYGVNSGEDTSDAKYWFGKIHPEDRSRTQSLFEKSETEKTPYEADYRVVLPDGSIRYQHSVGRPVLNGSGELVEFIGTAVDVTEQVQARAALQKAFDEIEKSEAKLRQVIETIPALAWSARPDGPAEFFNRPWLEYAGLSYDQARGVGWVKAVHPDDLNRLMEYWRSILASGKPGEIEARLRRFDGEYRWFLFRANPLRDKSGTVVKWYGTNVDIEDRKRAEQELKRSEAFLAEGQRLSRTGSFSWCVATNEITWSEELYRIFEFDKSLPVTLERIGSRVYPDDLPLLQDMIERARGAASDFEYQHRLLMPDQSVKHIHLFAHATRDKYGRLDYVGAAQDVTDLHTITDAIPIGISILAPDGSTLYVNQPALDRIGVTLQEVKGKGLLERICHPDDLDRILDERRIGLSKGGRFELEMRFLPIAAAKRIQQGDYRWHLSQYNPLKDESGKIVRWYVTSIDIDDRKRAEQKLRESEESLRTITDAIRQSIAVLAPDGTILYLNRVFRETTGLAMREVNDKTLHTRVFHPEDLDRVLAERQEGLLRGTPFEYEARLLMKEGQYRWFLVQYNPLKDEHGHIIRWYGAGTDIDDRKRSEQKLRRSEEDLRTMMDAIRQSISVLAADGTIVYVNRVFQETTGVTIRDGDPKVFLARAFHPDDLNRVLVEREAGLLRGTPFEYEARVLMRSGQYRWGLIQYNPLKDERGQIIRWYSTGTDIDDRKRIEEQLRNENLVLREEIDRSSMFEDIVGSSEPLRKVLTQVSKVAPSDSTVLILGETGTGKELIARAIHKRSSRASRAFIGVNCAAIPPSLIASELF